MGAIRLPSAADLRWVIGITVGQPLILVVDTRAEQARRLEAALARNGYRVDWCADSVDALIAIEDNPPALVILNWKMPFIHGAVIVRAMQVALRSPPPVVALIEPGDTPPNLAPGGPQAFLRTPLELTPLLRVVHAVLDGQTQAPRHEPSTLDGDRDHSTG